MFMHGYVNTNYCAMSHIRVSDISVMGSKKIWCQPTNTGNMADNQGIGYYYNSATLEDVVVYAFATSFQRVMYSYSPAYSATYESLGISPSGIVL
jgi:hypothetical protein